MQGSSNSKGKKLQMGLLGGGSYYEVEPFPLEAEMACFHPDDERANLQSWNGIGNTKPKYSINVYVKICAKYIQITAIFKKNKPTSCCKQYYPD